MYKLLIVDDEPLVQVGLKSMLVWKDLGIEICGTASNGQIAMTIIEKERPELIICDIKMPTMSGLELMKECNHTFGKLPVFIMLTSYEEFEYARKSLRYGAVEYLVKLELTKDVLTEAVQSAINKIRQITMTNDMARLSSSFDFQTLQNRFYMRLISNLFENEEALFTQASQLHIEFHANSYIAANLELSPPSHSTPLTEEQQLTLYNNTLNMFYELMSKYIRLKVLSLDLNYWAVIFFLPAGSSKENKHLLYDAITQTITMLFNYYNVTVLASFGSITTHPIGISVSYRDARSCMSSVTKEHPILFIDDLPAAKERHTTFDMALFREDIQKAFEEYNIDSLHDIITSISNLFDNDSLHYTQIMDVASNLLHLSITLLSNGNEVLSQIFSAEPDGYRCLYKQSSVPLLLTWLKQLEDGLTQVFREQKKDLKNRTVLNIKSYLQSHLCEHISLQKVASVFNLSPNYLSQIFKKYTNMGFSEYVTALKIERAKELLHEGNPKVYEIAEQLGFENAFYFSKVFKKATGISPKEYSQSKI